MADYNKVLLMGRLTRDVELKFTPSNQPVAKIGLAVGRRYKTREGEQREETTFVDCEAWGRTAEVMNQYLAKGKPVFIEGRLKLDQWQDQEGQNRSKLKVVIENFQFVDSKSDGGGGGGGYGDSAPQKSGSKPYAQPAATPSGGSTNYEPISEDDIPF